LVDGVDVTRLRGEARLDMTRKFGMLFQGAALFDSLTVGENIAFGLERYTALGRDEIRRVVAESLAKVGLQEIEDLMPHELSGGLRKRVGLARAIAYRPEIILYDEPSTGIDPIRADAINELVIILRREMKVTSLVITHDMVSAYKVADRMGLLYQGRIIALGTAEEIRRSENEVVQQFIHGRAEGPIVNW
jgi:phospholipid/cholesterol/gamma-HCH transport system ATP-binding protein